MAKGDYTPSFLSNLLEEGVPKPGSEEEIVAKWASSVLYGGGADTVRHPLLFLCVTRKNFVPVAKTDIDGVHSERLVSCNGHVP